MNEEAGSILPILQLDVLAGLMLKLISLDYDAKGRK